MEYSHIRITFSIFLALYLINCCFTQYVCTPPCLNNGRCLAANSCYCDTANSGWAGSRCEVPVCNGGCGPGNCTSPNNCDCTGTGWSGTNCQIPTCNPTCANGGSCTGVDACTCTSGWTGTFCTIASCTPPCQNGGLCTFPPSTCDCSYAPGWNGTYCDQAICTSVICQHGGYCSGPDTCNCEGTGYGGFQCELDVNECESVDPLACDALTTCTNLPGTYSCSPCPQYYTGTGKTGCDWNACNAGGCDPLTTCQQDLVLQTFNCSGCPAGYTGNGLTGCNDVNECVSVQDACDPLTTCTNTDGSYTCSACPSGYSGDGKSGCKKGPSDTSGASVVAGSLVVLFGVVFFS